jgi:hypothetical protein
VSRTALGPTQPPTKCVPGALSVGVKRPEREADHSPPSNVEVKNAWHGAQSSYRGKFTFLPLPLEVVNVRPMFDAYSLCYMKTDIPLVCLREPALRYCGTFPGKLFFLGRRLLALRPTPNLEDRVAV